MKDEKLCYTIGALLYCPANNPSIAHSIITEKFGVKYSLALCLEDTINDNHLQEAEQQLIESLALIHTAYEKKHFYLPKIFIRVRSYEQMLRLTISLDEAFDFVTGFIFPKFSIENADAYLEELHKVNTYANRKVYAMPIYENATIINLQKRYDILYALKNKLDATGSLILNIRVGGNDLCHYFGFRRHVDESIHKIRPISNIFSDLVTVYGSDYVISGPVWEYYNGPLWEKGIREEIKDDMLCGFIGKTVIHPNQIPIVNDSYKVAKADYIDAKNILNWNSSASLVAGSALNERMNEYKTHTNWAKKILHLAEYYGTY